jgi:hypothetical protein
MSGESEITPETGDRVRLERVVGRWGWCCRFLWHRMVLDEGSNVAGPSPRRITTVPPVEDCARDFRAYRKAVLEFLGITE